MWCNKVRSKEGADFDVVVGGLANGFLDAWAWVVHVGGFDWTVIVEEEDLFVCVVFGVEAEEVCPSLRLCEEHFVFVV